MGSSEQLRGLEHLKPCVCSGKRGSCTHPSLMAAENPAQQATKPQTWLGIQQQQKKPKRARKEQQPLMELPLPRSARLAQQAQPAPHMARHSDDTVEDRRAESALQRISGQQQLQSTVIVRAEFQITQFHNAGEKMPQQQVSDQCTAAQRAHKHYVEIAEVNTSAPLPAKDLVAGSAEVVPGTPVAVAAHVMQPLSQRTLAKPTQAPCLNTAPSIPDTVVERSSARLMERRVAQTLSPQGRQPEKAWARAGQPGQQGDVEGRAPHQRANCGVDEYDIDAALQQTDEQTAAAARVRRMSLPLPQNPAARGDADPQVTATPHMEVRLPRSSLVAGPAVAAGRGKLPKQAQPAQAGSPEDFGLSPTPHRAVHWRGHKPCAAAEPVPARPADSGCPSGLALDPSAAFVGLEGLVQAVQGDQPQLSGQPDKLQDDKAAAAAAPENVMKDAPGVLILCTDSMLLPLALCILSDQMCMPKTATPSAQ